MKLLTPNLPLSNCVIKLHMKLLTSNLPLGNCVIKLHQVTYSSRNVSCIKLPIKVEYLGDEGEAYICSFGFCRAVTNI